MVGSAMPTTVASMEASADPRTVASRTHRPAGLEYLRPGSALVIVPASSLHLFHNDLRAQPWQRCDRGPWRPGPAGRRTPWMDMTGALTLVMTVYLPICDRLPFSVRPASLAIVPGPAM